MGEVLEVDDMAYDGEQRRNERKRFGPVEQ